MDDDATWLDDIGTGLEQLILGPLQVLTPGYWEGVSSDANKMTADGSDGIAAQVSNGIATVGQGVAQAVGAQLPSEAEFFAGLVAVIIILALVAYILREAVG